jgi:hypothetical protein
MVYDFSTQALRAMDAHEARKGSTGKILIDRILEESREQGAYLDLDDIDRLLVRDIRQKFLRSVIIELIACTRPKR